MLSDDNRLIRLAVTVSLVLAVAISAAASDRVLKGTRQQLEVVPGENNVRHRCLTPPAFEKIRLPLERENPWSLPKAALAADFLDTINVLVLRYNFQYETVDDPNTTGRGLIDDSTDVETFMDTALHYVDAPPHDSVYFEAHLRALSAYWEFVSDSKITLQWDVYPSGNKSVYQLPYPMSHYGKCDFNDVVAGLEQYFIDGIQVADTTSPEIDFGRYDAVIMFHAGSDRQNDMGFPETCSDLFTGFITFGDSLGVDHDSNFVRTALLMPETANQDNRATALNGVLAHEFGHQLGLVDLYSTVNFMSMLGDFALMDNNGFGSGIDFGLDVGSVFGAIPVYPTAWSRAFLGFVDVEDYRQGSDIRLVAAEIVSNGVKIARVPITENEYYLLENRLIDFDGDEPSATLDDTAYVILGPTNAADELNGEYDFLLPGSGVLIYHVDERVAALDYDYDGEDNFSDNHLQWTYDIYGNPVDRFITLVEGDGFVNFGGYYRAGYGREEDMYRDDRNTSLTPNTNPQAVDNSGNNTHIYITGITRATDTTSDIGALMDSVILFDLEVDRMVDSFPVRAGYPVIGLSPIADDLDGDGVPEIIFASGSRLLVTTPTAKNFLNEYTGCTTCPVYEDTAYASVNSGQSYAIPLYAQAEGYIFGGPVTGRFADSPEETKMVAVGYPVGAGGVGRVSLYSLSDEDNNGQADLAYGMDTSFFNTVGTPVTLSFGEVLWAVTDSGMAYYKTSFDTEPSAINIGPVTQFHGICRDGDALVVLLSNPFGTEIKYVSTDMDSDALSLYDLDFTLGPVAADIDLDGVPEAVVASIDGGVAVVEWTTPPGFTVQTAKTFDYEFTSNPIIGDVDLDGQPDIVIGGVNAVYAFNHELTLKTNFPIEVYDRFPNDRLSAAPVMAGIELGGLPEIVFPTVIGNIYSFGDQLSYGFPLSAGEYASGSPVILSDDIGGKLGYLGSDGWFYLWHMAEDTDTDFWPMYGADPSGSFAFDEAKLPALKQYAELIPKGKFYNYPNPVVDGVTTIRYFLAEEASSVRLTLYDFSGQEIESMNGPTSGMVDNELVWQCGHITPGVYRCRIEADFGGNAETAFTDIAIIK